MVINLPFLSKFPLASSIPESSQNAGGFSIGLGNEEAFLGTDDWFSLFGEELFPSPRVSSTRDRNLAISKFIGTPGALLEEEPPSFAPSGGGSDGLLALLLLLPPLARLLLPPPLRAWLRLDAVLGWLREKPARSARFSSSRASQISKWASKNRVCSAADSHVARDIGAFLDITVTITEWEGGNNNYYKWKLGP